MLHAYSNKCHRILTLWYVASQAMLIHVTIQLGRLVLYTVSWMPCHCLELANMNQEHVEPKILNLACQFRLKSNEAVAATCQSWMSTPRPSIQCWHECLVAAMLHVYSGRPCCSKPEVRTPPFSFEIEIGRGLYWKLRQESHLGRTCSAGNKPVMNTFTLFFPMFISELCYA